ncbi:MAG: TIGR04084 family radical SAM/SPASM domain-containing protein [Desulfurococcales archaeon]|nr:TIGR04084 family radical SAM/SPASM domain-containing protein [Desulfurococcales archaeon]
MLWILHTTGKCNLRCSYCGGSIPERLMPWRITYDIDSLKKLLREDPDPTIIFYGGEPLLNSKAIMEIMDNVEARYGIQTNGTLPSLLPREYWERMETVLLSIDGVEWVTDKYRGKGIYRRVIETARWLSGFCKCRRIARMTVTSDTCIYRDVVHLLETGYFTHVHWQLNVVWSKKWRLLEWAKNRYLPGIARLARYFSEHIARGEVPGIIPFLGILTAEKKGGWGHVPCGAGKYSFSVTTDGRIIACPIALEEKWAVLGHVSTGILKRIEVKDSSPECMRCPYFKWCGGRCLFALYEKYWGLRGFRDVCWVTQRTIDHVLRIFPLVEKLVERGVISWEQILYDPLRDSTEVIP